MGSFRSNLSFLSIWRFQGNNADAKRLYNEALSTDVARHGVNHEDVARDRLNLAMVLEAEVRGPPEPSCVRRDGHVDQNS